MQPQKKYVLYADDDIDDRFLIDDIFAFHPAYSLLSFDSGVKLIDYLDRSSHEGICLVVLDFNMPLLDGLETLERIRSNRQWVAFPVVMFTTTSKTFASKKALAMGAQAIVVKPASFEEIKSAAAQMLAYSICSNYQLKDWLAKGLASNLAWYSWQAVIISSSVIQPFTISFLVSTSTPVRLWCTIKSAI